MEKLFPIMKHKIAILWIIFVFIPIFISVFAEMANVGGGDSGPLYNFGVYLAVALIFLGCPVCILDNKIAGKIKKNELLHGTKAQLIQKEQEIARKDYELEKVRTEKQLEIMEKEIELKRKEIALKEKEEQIKELKKLREELTEDDIKVSKEKHFCLVHKGDIKGYSFICPSCGTFYCINCVEAIIDIENECWSCGIEIEESVGSEIKKRKKGKKVLIKEDKTYTNEASRFCKFCGIAVDPKAKICKGCGSHIS